MAIDPNSIVDYLASTGKASDFGSRSALYGSSGLNLGAYTGSAAQNTALLNSLKTPKPVVAPVATPAAPSVSPSTTMDASKISTGVNGAPVVVPPAPAPTDYSGVTGSIPTIESIVAPAAPTKTETEQTGIIASLKDLYGQMTGKSAAQAKADEAAGLPQFNTQLNDINAQIRQLQAESSSATIRAEDRLAPTFAIQGEQTRIEHERAIKALGLSAISSNIQGNIALAQQQADRAVEIEFGPIQEKIDYQQKLLDLNEKTLTREDKKATALQQARLDERQRLLDNAKEDKKIVLGWAAEAGKNGASALVINQALAEGDPAKALSILGRFLEDPIAKQQALANLAQTRAQTAKLNAPAERAPKNGSFQEINGRQVLVDPVTGEIIKDYGEKPLSVSEKKAEADKIASAEAATPAVDAKLTLAKEILDNKYLTTAVGPNTLSRTSLSNWLTSGKDTFIAKTKQLVSQETLATLLALKAAGGTLGAISEKELGILQNAATVLSSFEVKDGDGNVIGYQTSEKAFRDEVQKILDSTQRVKDALTATTGGATTPATTTKSGKPFDVAAAKAAGYTDEEIQAYLTSN